MTLFSSNFVLISICKFFKTSNCTCTWKIRSPYLHQIAWEIILLPVNNLHEKHIRVSWDKILAVCYLQFALVLQLCTHVTNLHLCYMKNVLFFSQSGMHNFLCTLLVELQHSCSTLAHVSSLFIGCRQGSSLPVLDCERNRKQQQCS